MSIYVNEQQKLFTLHTKNSSYQFFADEHGYLEHLYYGAPIGEADMRYMRYFSDCGFSPNPYDLRGQRQFSLDTLSQEYSGYGCGDFRLNGVQPEYTDGSRSADFHYQGYEKIQGKYAVQGMPACYDNGGEWETLRIDLKDEVSGLELQLYYGVCEKLDVITRCAVFHNGSSDTIRLHKAASACLDLPFGDWDVIHFQGRHCMERIPQRQRIPHGIQTISSQRGASSHQHNPFVILANPSTTETAGECYGAMLVYSGSFAIELEKSQLQSTRLVAGIGTDSFLWNLKEGDTFWTPEVIFSFSNSGLETLSNSYQELLRKNVCRGPYKNAPRPILINNWEATYFDFTGEKLLNIAKEAQSLGIEMLVLDDGWFGTRNDDTDGLGDWFVNEEKLGGNLQQLIEKINQLGLKFGLWVEPEAICIPTKLYQQHPDWAFQIPGRKPTMGRCELILDLSRKEVVDYLYERIHDILSNHHIEYVKWDMNRHMTDVFSAALPAHQQGEVKHRYMLGLYDLLERLTQAFPEILFEGCSGGGGRFDAGMLYYSPQIWCSDDTDAVHRLQIQYGTSFGYPYSAMGSHVSAVPNHQTGRSVPMSTRGIVAMSGAFGYELDLQQLTPQDKEEIRLQIQQYRKRSAIVSNGRQYRLTNAVEDRYFTAWQFVSQDGTEALLNLVVLNPQANPWGMHVRLRGLQEDAQYKDIASGKVYSGAALMNGGYTFPTMQGDYASTCIHFVKE